MTRISNVVRCSVRVVLCSLTVLLISANAFSQQLLWELQEDLSPGLDVPQALLLRPNEVVLVGQADTPDEGYDFVLQPLGRANGRVKATARVSISHNCSVTYSCNRPQLVTSLDETVFAASSALAPDGQSAEIYVAAYEPGGVIQWANYWDAANDVPWGIAASARAVVVVGFGGVVRSYDPTTGAILWTDRVDASGPQAPVVAIAGNRVFIAATTSTASGEQLVLRCYNAVSGAFRWEMQRSDAYPADLVAAGGRVFLAGSVTVGSRRTPYLAALETQAGVLLWEDEAPPPFLGTLGYFTHLAVNGNQIVAGGGATALGTTARVSLEVFIRSYEVSSGQIEWQTGVSDIQVQELAALTLDRDAVYGVGVNSHSDFWNEVLVLAYDSSSGAPLWEDRSHRTNPADGDSRALAVVAGQNRLFVAGVAGSDALVRAYDIRGDQKPR